MLNEDPTLPFLRMAWSPQQMGEFFNRCVIPRFCPGRQVSSVAIEDMTYKPARQCVILYVIRFEDGPCRRAVVTFVKDQKFRRTYLRQSSQEAGARAGTAFASVVFLPEYRCLVEFFPIDYKLSWLAQAMDPGEMASHLSSMATAHMDASPRQPEATVLQYRPHARCVVRYALGPQKRQGWGDVIGKLYPQGPKARRAWIAQTAIYAQATPDVVVPKPLRLSDRWHLVLMECVHGTPMNELLGKGTIELNQAKQAASLIARALAALHRMHHQSEDVRTLENQAHKFRDGAIGLQTVAPLLADEIRALLDRISMLAPRFKLDRLSCIHGECKASQFLMSLGRAAIVDFDRVCLGDRAVDVGNFMAHLHSEAVQGNPDLRDLASHFLAAYGEGSPEKDFEARARLFQSASLARIAARAFTRAPHDYARAGASSLPALLLREAGECLATL